ncbi:MAG: class I SAM-dependent methyltransferase [Actinobacteria bacterium]|nr:class I SAM-dependent methyltransferase [Actinomycetota bacterium]MCG2802434.1 class I SAM-dependent methyltransferase [Cellulomonas sp.]
MSELVTAAAYWEDRYAGTDRMWSGRVNPVLAQTAAGLPAGRALDLGCGEGGDAVWLAQQGWQVTGVDLSPTAVERGSTAAAGIGIAPDRLQLIAADLATWTTESAFDLVTASFLQSWPVPIPRAEILRRATGFVAPGGHLLVVAHAAAPSWAPREMVHGHTFPTPDDDLAALALDPHRWSVLVAQTRERPATGPDGEQGTLIDTVVLARRDR